MNIIYTLIGVVIGILLGLMIYPYQAISQETPFIPPTKPTVVIETIDEKIDRYALKYAVSSSVMRKTIRCESNFNPKAVNWSDSHALSKGSHGIAQFSKETIKGFGKAIGIENADPYNVDHSLEIMAYMFSKGQARHWTCARRIGVT
jgi:hypothetical protein